MACMKLRPGFYLMLIAPVLLFAATQPQAQTPETKAKPTGSISGRITIGEKPAPGITVVVSAPNSLTPMGQTTSDADGNYHIGGLASGQINTTPVAPVYVFPMSLMSGQGQVVNLSANEAVEGIDFKLTRGGVITGRITDADGRPVIEERITLIAVDQNGVVARGSNIRPANVMMYQTDDRGVYRIYGLPAGHYKLSAGDAGRSGGVMRVAGYYPRTYYPDSSEIGKAAIIDVSEGGETKNVDIKLGRRALTYTVSGRIVDVEGGQPLPGISLSYGTIQQNQNQSYVSGTAGPSSPTNSQGEFRMEGLTPGRYVVMINPANFNLSNSPAPKYYSDPLPFEILDSDVTNLELKAERGLSLSGVVVPDGITDKTLARISRLMVTGQVESRPTDIRTFGSNSASRINPDGSFSLEGLPPGKVTLDVGGYDVPELAGFNITRIEYNGPVPNRRIELTAGQSISGVKIYVAFGTGVIRGQVKVEGGTVAAEGVFYISANRQGESSQFSGLTDSRGRFLIKGISPGTYEVVLQVGSLGSIQLPRGFQRIQRQTVTVVDGADTEVLFTVNLSGKDVP